MLEVSALRLQCSVWPWFTLVGGHLWLCLVLEFVCDWNGQQELMLEAGPALDKTTPLNGDSDYCLSVVPFFTSLMKLCPSGCHWLSWNTYIFPSPLHSKFLGFLPPKQAARHFINITVKQTHGWVNGGIFFTIRARLRRSFSQRDSSESSPESCHVLLMLGLGLGKEVD